MKEFRRNSCQQNKEFFLYPYLLSKLILTLVIFTEIVLTKCGILRRWSSEFVENHSFSCFDVHVLLQLWSVNLTYLYIYMVANQYLIICNMVLYKLNRIVIVYISALPWITIHNKDKKIYILLCLSFLSAGWMLGNIVSNSTLRWFY